VRLFPRKKAPTQLEVISGLIACSTIRGIKPNNDDNFRVGHAGGCKFLVMGDGVTNSLGGGDASRITVNAFYDTIEKAYKVRQKMDFQVLERGYQNACNELKKTALERTGKPEGFETTVIAVAETNISFFITYLGDGRLYLVRGDLERGAQLMISHRTGGVLGGALGAYGLHGRPVYIEHSKSFEFGEIIIAGTDGVFDLSNTDGKPAIDRILEKLRAEGVTSSTETLRQAIDQTLENMVMENLIEDDATLGVIISGNALRELGRRTP
jgi:serine/threonine protein phosphatase PrpC